MLFRGGLFVEGKKQQADGPLVLVYLQAVVGCLLCLEGRYGRNETRGGEEAKVIMPIQKSDGCSLWSLGIGRFGLSR